MHDNLYEEEKIGYLLEQMNKVFFRYFDVDKGKSKFMLYNI